MPQNNFLRVLRPSTSNLLFDPEIWSIGFIRHIEYEYRDKNLRVYSYALIFHKIKNLSPNLKIGFVGVCDARNTNMAM